MHRPPTPGLRAIGILSLVSLCAILCSLFWIDRISSIKTPEFATAGIDDPPTNTIRQVASTNDALVVASPLPRSEQEIVQSLLHDCPTIANISGACMQALDRRYLDEFADLPVVPLSDPPTWRQLIEKAEANRNVVLTTVGRADCRLSDDGLSYDLRNSCGADAMADFASLYSKCVVDMSENEYLASQDYHDLELEEIALEFDNDLYWKKRLDLEDARHRAAWTLTKCGDFREVTAPIPGYQISWSEFRVDDVSWFPLSVPSSTTDLFGAIYEEVWDHPLYPVVFRDALMEWSARLGAEVAISQYVGDLEYNRALMGRYPGVAYLHRAQLDIKELRRTFLRDERVALERLSSNDHGSQGIELLTRLPADYEKSRRSRLDRLRRDEEIIRERYARLAMAAADRTGIETDEAALRVWVVGSGH